MNTSFILISSSNSCSYLDASSQIGMLPASFFFYYHFFFWILGNSDRSRTASWEKEESGGSSSSSSAQVTEACRVCECVRAVLASVSLGASRWCPFTRASREAENGGTVCPPSPPPSHSVFLSLFLMQAQQWAEAAVARPLQLRPAPCAKLY